MFDVKRARQTQAIVGFTKDLTGCVCLCDLPTLEGVNAAQRLTADGIAKALIVSRVPTELSDRTPVFVMEHDNFDQASSYPCPTVSFQRHDIIPSPQLNFSEFSTTEQSLPSTKTKIHSQFSDPSVDKCDLFMKDIDTTIESLAEIAAPDLTVYQTTSIESIDVVMSEEQHLLPRMEPTVLPQVVDELEFLSDNEKSNPTIGSLVEAPMSTQPVVDLSSTQHKNKSPSGHTVAAECAHLFRGVNVCCISDTECRWIHSRGHLINDFVSSSRFLGRDCTIQLPRRVFRFTMLRSWKMFKSRQAKYTVKFFKSKLLLLLKSFSLQAPTLL